MDCEKLINEVHKRQCLWDMGAKPYNRNLIEIMWDEVSDELKIQKNDARKKWKSLRDNFRTEFKKELAYNTSGSDSGLQHKRKWAYMEQMSFLKDVLSTTVPSNDIQNKRKAEINHFSEGSNSETVTESATKENRETISRNDFSELIPTTSNRNSSRKRKSEQNEIIAIEKEKKSRLYSNDKMRTDGDYNFLVSFLPIMKNMNDIQKLKFRLKMSEVAYEIGTENIPSTTTNWTISNVPIEKTILSPAPASPEEYKHDCSDFYN